MRIGDHVKIIKQDVARKGEVGQIVGKEMTLIGLLWRVRFDDKDGLYSSNDFRVMVEE